MEDINIYSKFTTYDFIANTKSLKDIETIAIGRFDGMHIAHQAILNLCNNENCAAVVIENFNSNLTPCATRENYCDLKFFYYFFSEISMLSPIQFIDLLLKDFIDLKKIIVGYDFKFGFNRAGDIYTLIKNSNLLVEVVEKKCIDNEPIHSTKIRKYLADRDIYMANKFLGRNYSISGESIKGQGIGKRELVPTINIKCDKYFIPGFGVYATKTNGVNSITFIGERLSTDSNFSIETHIIDFKDINLDESIDIEFVGFIRENKKFQSLDRLKKQINLDINMAKLINNSI